MEIFNKILNNLQEAFSTPHQIVCNIIDIILTYLLVYCVIVLLRKSRSTGLLKVIITLVIVTIVINSFQSYFPIIGQIAKEGIIILLLVIFVLFSDETRKSVRLLYSKASDRGVYNVNYDCTEDELKAVIDEIIKAIQNLSKKNVGALIVIAPDKVPDTYLDSGTKLNAVLSSQLIEGVFSTKVPIHDGAMFIHGDKVLAAGCFLPLTQDEKPGSEYGARFRAAIAETEQYENHLAIIVSEDSGVISAVKRGNVVRYYDSEMLSDVLYQAYGLMGNSNED